MTTASLFIGTVGEGVWRSTDGGTTWCRSAKGMFVECDVRTIVVDRRRAGVLYSGTNEGVWRTENNGDDWTRLNGPLDSLVTWSLLLWPQSEDVLFAGTRPAGVYRRAAGGPWQKCSADMAQECPGIMFNRVTTLLADPLDRERLWAGVEIDGVWTSRDRGETWQKVGKGLSSADIHGLVVVPGVDGRRTLLATTNNDLNVSHDDGQTWQPQKVEKSFGHGYCRGLVQRPDRREVLFLGNGDGPPGTVGAAWRSQDAGRTWQRMALPGTPNSTIWDFTFDPTRPDHVYAYSVSGEVYHSPDGGERWLKLPHEFGEIRAIACAAAA
jgi:photosystem II stability/assembly factor-like uncharacterized protein